MVCRKRVFSGGGYHGQIVIYKLEIVRHSVKFVTKNTSTAAAAARTNEDAWEYIF